MTSITSHNATQPLAPAANESASALLRSLLALALWLLACVFLPLWLVGCGGGDEPVAPASVSVRVGPAGGTVTGPDGVQVIIPAGALASTTTIGIARNAAGSPAPLDAYPPAGPTYEFTPHGQVFNQLITIRAPVPSAAAGTSLFMASPGNDWKQVDTVVTNGIGQWQRNSFSYGYYNTTCGVPAAMSQDPYWCALNRSSARISATPTTAITQTNPGNLDSGDAGSYRVTQEADLQLRSNFQVKGNCSVASVRLQQRVYNPTSFAYGPAQTLATQNPPLVADGGRLRGTATFALAASSLANGKHLLSLIVSFNCPGVVRSNGMVTGWDSVNTISRTISDGMVLDLDIPPPTVFYTVGGTVGGLTGTGLVLQNNGGDNLAIGANGPFTFATPVGAGAPYAVTVQSQPTGQTCSVNNASGTASGPVGNVAVTCSAAAAGKAWQTAALLENQTGEAFTPSVAADSNGNAIVLWTQLVPSLSTQHQIWTRRYSPNTGWGAAERIPLNADYLDFATPRLAFDALGNATAVFSGSTPDGSEIWTAHYTASTSRWATATQISDNGVEPQIAIDGAGDAFVAWQQYDRIQVSNIAFAQYTASSGQWSAPQVIDSDTSAVYYPQIAVDASGNAVVIWTTADSGDVRASRLTPGVGWSPDVSIGAPAPARGVSQYRIAFSPAENAFIAVWSQHDGAAYSLFTRRLVNGNWGALAVVESSSEDALEPNIATDGLGNVTVVWVQQDASVRNSVWARRYTNSVAGTAQRIDNGSNYTFGGEAHLAGNNNGDTVAVWVQSGQVWSSRLAAGGGWSNAEVIGGTGAAGMPTVPRTAVDPSGNAFAAWQQTGGGNDIWSNVFK